MTCTLRHRASLSALALAAVLGGCSGGGADRGHDAVSPAGPGFVRLLADADKDMAKGALVDAGRKLDEARSLAPDSPDLWLAIARLRLRGGEHLTALEAADRALALGPDHAPVLLLRALMVRDARGGAEAIRWFEAALEADADNPDILAEYAATLGDSGQAGAMLKAVRRLEEAAPKDPRVPYLQAVLAARGGRYAIARRLLVRSGMAARGAPAALLLDAVISLEEGDAATAAATLEPLVARQPANARLRELLARAMLAGGRDGELVARFGAEAMLPEASPYLMMVVARAYERMGDRGRAAPLLARAYGGKSGGPVLLAVRDGLPAPTAEARGALLAGRSDDARDQAAKLRAKLPASADVASLAGDTLLGAGDPRGAMGAYIRAAEARRTWLLMRKAVWAEVRLGNSQAAEALLMRHVAGDTETASAVTALADCKVRRNDWTGAALLLDHALILGAGHDPALLGQRLRAAQALDNQQDVLRFAELLAEVRPRSLATR